jgi:hypothetical protein
MSRRVFLTLVTKLRLMFRQFKEPQKVQKALRFIAYAGKDW